MATSANFSSIIRRWGVAFSALGSDNSFRAVIQPRFGGLVNLSGPFGYGSERSYNLYIESFAKAGELLQGSLIVGGSHIYKIIRIEKLTMGTETAYHKAVVIFAGEEEEF